MFKPALLWRGRIDADAPVSTMNDKSEPPIRAATSKSGGPEATPSTRPTGFPKLGQERMVLSWAA